VHVKYVFMTRYDSADSTADPSGTVGQTPRRAVPPAPFPLALTSPVPLYDQVREALQERIRSGEWRPGDRLPTIRELCLQYGVSRVTILQALDALTRAGLIGRRQGKGIFVTRPKIEQGPIALTSFTEDMERRGQVPATRVLELGRIPAPAHVAERLGLTVGQPVVLLRRLRLADGEPLALMTSHLPDHLFPGLADRTGPIDSLYRLLQEQYGVTPTTAIESYEPARLGAAEARLLGVRTGALAFSVERVARDQLGRLIEFTASLLRGDRHRVILELRRFGA